MLKVIIKAVLFLFLVTITGGCSWFQSIGAKGESIATNSGLYESFGPAKIEILPLTELSDTGKGKKITAYVSLLDFSGSSEKWPAVFRFELYEQVQRSVEPVGRRIKLWDDIDLKTPAKNNQYWQDFLRCYKFSLDFESSDKSNFILRATIILANDKRLSAQIYLKPIVMKQ